MATALCAWLRGQGVRVAPCKTENMGRTERTAPCPALQAVWDEDGDRAEGARCGQVWGTCLHGWLAKKQLFNNDLRTRTHENVIY